MTYGNDFSTPPTPPAVDTSAVQRLFDAEELLREAVRLINAAPGSAHSYEIAARIDAWLEGE